MKSKEFSKILLAMMMIAFYIRPGLSQSSTSATNDSNTPLYLLKPNYPVPYGPVKVEEITEVLTRIYNFLNVSTPTRIIDSRTKQEIIDLAKPDSNAIIEPGLFRIVGHRGYR
jgi:unsaturated rhamnogalacturonyl hydrolase